MVGDPHSSFTSSRLAWLWRLEKKLCLWQNSKTAVNAFSIGAVVAHSEFGKIPVFAILRITESTRALARLWWKNTIGVAMGRKQKRRDFHDFQLFFHVVFF